MSGITSLPYRDFLGRVNELVNRRKIKNNNFRYHENAVKALNLLSKNVNIVNSREKHLLKRTSLIEVADFKENSHFFRPNSGETPPDIYELFSFFNALPFL